jgi:tetratricopeptide (TPR) repeat protein
MSREEKFFRMSINLPFEEVKDERDETSIPELEHVANLRDAGNVQDAIDYGKALMKMYPDNDLIPFMIAYIYYQRHFPDEALEIAADAILHCPRKYRLYSVAGLAEFDRDNLPEALVWWARSVVAQCTVTDYQEYDPFLHMAHAAELIGAKAQADVFFTMSDVIAQDTMRLDQPAIDQLTGIKSSWARDPYRRVIEHIEATYLRE